MSRPSWIPADAAPVDEHAPPAPALVAALVGFLDLFPVRDYWRRKGQLPELETTLDQARAYVRQTGRRAPAKRRKPQPIIENHAKSS